MLVLLCSGFPPINENDEDLSEMIEDLLISGSIIFFVSATGIVDELFLKPNPLGTVIAVELVIAELLKIGFVKGNEA